MDNDELATAVRDRQVILFVGSGVSAGLGVPTWSGLINHLAQQMGYDPELFRTNSGNYPTLAEYYKIEHDSIGPLRSWMDTKWKLPNKKLKKSSVHQLIANLNFPLIYTTNYDRFIEQSFEIYKKPFKKIVNVRNIGSVREGETQIVKFHGDFDDDNSIVLTETDYYERLSFESPLDIKLRSDALGKSLLFIGYSLSDINIRLLLYKLSQTWKTSGLDKHQPVSYLFQSRPDPIQEAVLDQWGVRVVTEDVNDPGAALCAFLKQLQT